MDINNKHIKVYGYKHLRKIKLITYIYILKHKALSYKRRIVIFYKVPLMFVSISYIYTLYFRKAVKAAIVLLPLLGITNIVNLIDPPAESVVQFGLWSYSTYFLVSFQGFFISLLYCYLNGEVRIIPVHVSTLHTYVLSLCY